MLHVLSFKYKAVMLTLHSHNGCFTISLPHQLRGKQNKRLARFFSNSSFDPTVTYRAVGGLRIEQWTDYLLRHGSVAYRAVEGLLTKCVCSVIELFRRQSCDSCFSVFIRYKAPMSSTEFFSEKKEKKLLIHTRYHARHTKFQVFSTIYMQQQMSTCLKIAINSHNL